MWFEGKWMKLEDIMLIEVSQAQKDKDHMFSLTREIVFLNSIFRFVFSHMYRYLHFYLLTIWWTSGLFPLFGYCEERCYEHF
jgi:hypothetical protein